MKLGKAGFERNCPAESFDALSDVAGLFERISKVVQDCSIVWINSKCLSKCCDRGIGFTRFLQYHTKVTKRFGEPWIDFDRPSIGGDCLSKPAHSRENIAQIIRSFGPIRGSSKVLER